MVGRLVPNSECFEVSVCMEVVLSLVRRLRAGYSSVPWASNPFLPWVKMAGSCPAAILHRTRVDLRLRQPTLQRRSCSRLARSRKLSELCRGVFPDTATQRRGYSVEAFLLP